MPGTRINSYSIGDVDLTSLMETIDNQRIGYHAVSLTEWETSNKPKIAQGSRIEVNGAIFLFDESGDEDIAGSPSDGTVYIRLLPDGETITAEFTNDVPVWDDEKQGWYESGTNNRYLNFAMTKSVTDYTDKYEFNLKNNKIIKYYSNGDIYIDGDIELNGTLNKSGTPVYGYMTDGTPLYAKEITITINNGDTAASAAHNIANALTNDRIHDLRSRVFSSPNIYLCEGSNTSAIIPISLYYDDTFVRLTRGNSTGDYTHTIFIVYE